ncbi:hypothetical protein QE152_g13794 [Popillia japonica]|uniref:Uncharacterized protein n=1 Tax=Popillia japonica TaxID=7064 RepID=A0AAW1LA06_POPJA
MVRLKKIQSQDKMATYQGIRIVNNHENNDIVKFQYNCINGTYLFNIKFGTAVDTETFLRSGFADKITDTEQLSSDQSTPPSPEEPQVE